MMPAAGHTENLTAERIEISNGVQQGPARITGQFGTSLDYSNAGNMMFIVAVVFDNGSRDNLSDSANYEAAIVEAEKAGLEWEVPVIDQVAP
jgi:hypothetical protein